MNTVKWTRNPYGDYVAYVWADHTLFVYRIVHEPTEDGDGYTGWLVHKINPRNPVPWPGDTLGGLQETLRDAKARAQKDWER
jgi:hypothetical protein